MNEALALSLSLLAGVLLGTLFFLGLWWTVRRALESQYPAVWFSGSLVLRTGIALSGFMLVAQGDSRRWLACLLGFTAARALVRPAPRGSLNAP